MSEPKISVEDIARFQKAINEGDVRYVANALKNPTDLPFEPFQEFMMQIYSAVLPVNRGKKMLKINGTLQDVPQVTHIPGFRGCRKTFTAADAATTALLSDDGNLRILITSGTLDKGNELLDLINQKIHHPLVQPAFPMFKDAEVKSGWFSPLRTTIQRPTVSVGSPRSVKAGWRFDLIFADDLMTEQIRTEDAVRDSNERFKDLLKLLEPDGHLVHVCTRLSPNDIVAQAEENRAKGFCRDFVYTVPVYKLRTDGTENEIADRKRRQAKGLQFIREDDVNLTWAARMPWAAVRNQMADERGFRSQYLLDPLPAEGEIHFDDAPIRANFVDALKLGYVDACPYLIDVDLAGYNNGDDIGITTGLWDCEKHTLVYTSLEGRQFSNIDQFLTHLMTICQTCLSKSRYAPIVRIENARGAKDSYEPLIQAKAKEMGLKEIRIVWQVPVESRTGRYRNLRDGIASRKVLFDVNCHPEKFIQQATGYSTRKSNFRDDVMDSAAQLYEFAQSLLVPPARRLPGGYVYDSPIPMLGERTIASTNGVPEDWVKERASLYSPPVEDASDDSMGALYDEAKKKNKTDWSL